MASLFLRSLDHSQRRTTIGRTLLDEWSARRRDIYLTTRTNTHEGKSLHASGGIPTHNSNKRVAVHPRLIPRGHWNPPFQQNASPKFWAYLSPLRSFTCPTHSGIFDVNLKMCTKYKSQISIYIIIILPKNRLTSLAQLQSSVSMVYQCFYFRAKGTSFLKRKKVKFLRWN
jgi:hypothetical protein